MTTGVELTATGTRALVVWDVDGTLTRSDTLLPFLRLIVGSRRWVKTMAQAARATASHGASRDYVKAFLLRQCLAGRETAEVLAAAREFAVEIEAHRCRTDAIRRWSWHHARGDLQILASASPAVYVQPLGDLLGANKVLATALKVEDGRFTGDIDGANCRGREKALRVRELITAIGPEAVWVYSDSLSDTPCFDLADIAVRVRPWSFLPSLPPAVRHLPIAPGKDA